MNYCKVQFMRVTIEEQGSFFDPQCTTNSSIYRYIDKLDIQTYSRQASSVKQRL